MANDTSATGAPDARVDDTQQELYPADVALRPAFVEHHDTLHTVLGLSTAEREQRERQFTEDIRQLGLDPYGIGARLYAAGVSADTADLREDAEDPERAQRDKEDLRRTLASTYGADTAEDLLRRAQKFVKQNRRIDALLGRRGLGNRPDIVVPIIEHVHRTNFR